jgi:cytochrome c biogenesis protein CcmG/thiol:disulfide interchange protein DsbE
MMHDEETLTEAPRRSNTATWFVIVIVVAMFFGWVLFLKPEISMKRAMEAPGVGQPLVALDLQPLTGTTDGLTLDNLRGKVSLINYWGPWCGFCVQEFPHLIELRDKYRDNPEFAFVSVSSGGDSQENVNDLRSETEAFMRARSVAFPTYVDLGGASRQILLSALSQPSMGYPTTIVLDRAGIIRGVWLGYEPGFEQQMEKLVAKQLSEK